MRVLSILQASWIFTLVMSSRELPQKTMNVSRAIERINKTKMRRDTTLLLILHSDRGSRYVSRAYREATEKFQLGYGHKGYPYDNSRIESFHALIKWELTNQFKIRDTTYAYSFVFEYIENFYDTIRIHSHCDYMPPEQFERFYDKVTKDVA